MVFIRIIIDIFPYENLAVSHGMIAFAKNMTKMKLIVFGRRFQCELSCERYLREVCECEGVVCSKCGGIMLVNKGVHWVE